MTRAVRGVFVLLLMLLLGASAQARTPLPIHFTASARPSPARPGEAVTVTVRAVVDAGWHVYSVVATPNGPSPTDITTLTQGTPLAAATEDPPTRKLDPNFHAVVGYHEGAATFQRVFRLSPNTSPGSIPFTVGIHYQTCNDKICLPPTDTTVSVPLIVEAGPVRAAYSHPAGSVVATSGTPSNNLAWALLALGAGLLAIATPCVFPLIPITLTNFVKQADGDRRKLTRLSFGYALGIVALYVVLGMVFAGLLRVSHFSPNQFAANPWVNLTEFALFVVFAFSFFEVVPLSLPGGLGAVQQAARKHGGTAGLLLLGATFVLGSFTCTAPFIGTLLVAAAGGSYARPLLGMLLFAVAFTSPFFVFGAFPQWIGHIPKSGVWLARLKATLGFVELAAALKFLSNADQVWQWKLLTQPVLLAAWALIFLLASLYLMGLLRFGVVADVEPAHAAVPWPRRAWAGAFALATAYCFWGLAGRPLSPYVGAFLPPPGYGGAGIGSDAGLLPWLGSYDAALTQARVEGKPLLIDFTGYTCTNCRLNEKNVFPRPAVQTALAGFVRAQLYTDGGPDKDKNQALQQTKFGDVALPLYGIVDSQTGAVLSKTEGVQSADGFRRFLAQGKSLASPMGETALAPPLSAPSEPAAGADTSAWLPYSPAAAQEAAASGKVTLVDFTAKWCVNCKDIERNVFSSAAVTPALSHFVTLRADLTQWTSAPSVVLQKQYGFDSLPTIIFLDRAGHELKPLRITGRLSVADFQRRMQAAQAAP